MTTTRPHRLSSGRRKRICRNLRQLYGDRCFYCTRQLAPETLTLDHLIPLARGGTHEMDNLVLACAKCNREKGDLTWLEYLTTTRYYVRRLAVAREGKRMTVETIDSLEVPNCG